MGRPDGGIYRLKGAETTVAAVKLKVEEGFGIRMNAKRRIDIVMEGELTWDGKHTVQYTDDLEL